MNQNYIFYGGDYNPEQWPEESWQGDIDKLKEAGINTLTLNVFSWALLQKSEDEYDFSMLDKIVDLACQNDMNIIMATSTAAMPAWMVKKYPDMTRVDYLGRKRKFGGRHNHCPNSPTYRKFSPALAGKLAERYGHLDNIVAWHICNEYGGVCYCENCEKEFRKWLKDRYKTLDNLNKAWNTNFWSHTYYDWDEIIAPNGLGDGMSSGAQTMAGHALDWQRFNTDSIVRNMTDEIEAIRQYDKTTPVTTNLMGDYKPLDYRKFALHLDFVSWDNYPSLDTPYTYTALRHDLMRSLKHQDPFWLMEQTPSQQNWQPYNALKRPGQLRLMSYQAMAHGADHILYFQMKQSVGGCEKFHGAVIGHSNTEDTRVFKEVQQLGKELESLKDKITGARTPAKTALLFDWPTWWGLEYTSGPNKDLKYAELLTKWYDALNRRGIPVDLAGYDEDFSKYEIIYAPLLYMVNEELAQKLEEFVSNGGKLVLTSMSGLVGESDNVWTGGYPGLLRNLAGVWVEEIDSLLKDQNIKIELEGHDVHGSLVCDIMHMEGAEPIGSYQEQFYAGTPAAARNSFGDGVVYYIGFMPEEDALSGILEIVHEKPLTKLPEGLETAVREKEGKRYTFLMNHLEKPIQVSLDLEGIDILSGRKEHHIFYLPPYGAQIIESDFEAGK